MVHMAVSGNNVLAWPYLLFWKAKLLILYYYSGYSFDSRFDSMAVKEYWNKYGCAWLVQFIRRYYCTLCPVLRQDGISFEMFRYMTNIPLMK